MTTDVKKVNDTVNSCEECVIVPSVDIYETPEEFVLKADIPGVSRENLEITAENNELTINGTVDEGELAEESLRYQEYRLYNYRRSFKIGSQINTGAINAKLENGVLTLSMPKSEQVKPHKIQIAAG